MCQLVGESNLKAISCQWQCCSSSWSNDATNKTHSKHVTWNLYISQLEGRSSRYNSVEAASLSRWTVLLSQNVKHDISCTVNLLPVPLTVPILTRFAVVKAASEIVWESQWFCNPSLFIQISLAGQPIYSTAEKLRTRTPVWNERLRLWLFVCSRCEKLKLTPIPKEVEWSHLHAIGKSTQYDGYPWIYNIYRFDESQNPGLGRTW